MIEHEIVIQAGIEAAISVGATVEKVGRETLRSAVIASHDAMQRAERQHAARELGDVLADWIARRIQRDPTAKVPAGELYDDYSAWCARKGALLRSPKHLSQELMEMGFERHRAGGRRYFLGLRLAPELI